MIIRSIRIDEFAKEICKMRNKMLQMELWGAPAFKRKADTVEPWKEREAGKWEVTEGKERELLPQMKDQLTWWMISAERLPCGQGVSNSERCPLYNAQWVKMRSESGGKKNLPSPEESLEPLNCQFHCSSHTDPDFSLWSPSISWSEWN